MRRSAFSLVEVVVVVLVLGILAGIAAPRFVGVVDEAAIAATVSQLQLIEAAAELCFVETGVWPTNVDTKVMPTELEPYLRHNAFSVPCPIGGAYDWDGNNRGYASSVKITNGNPDLELLRAIDQRIDDGDLATGRFTRTTGPARLVIAF